MGRWSSGSSGGDVFIELGYVGRRALEIKNKVKGKKKEESLALELPGAFISTLDLARSRLLEAVLPMHIP